jgi:hypothetical protein
MLANGSAAEWDAVVQKAMAKSTEKRYQTAEEFSLALPDLPALSASGTRSPALAVRPTRIPAAGTAATDFAPAPSGVAAPPWQSQAETPAEPARPKQKIPTMALILGAAGVLAVVLLMAVIVMRIRAGNEASGGNTTPPAVVVAPHDDSQQMESQKPVDTSVPGGQPAVTIPVGPGGAVGTTNGKGSAPSGKGTRDDRREAALRALDGKDGGSKNSKRSAALKALDQ